MDRGGGLAVRGTSLLNVNNNGMQTQIHQSTLSGLLQLRHHIKQTTYSDCIY